MKNGKKREVIPIGIFSLYIDCFALAITNDIVTLIKTLLKLRPCCGEMEKEKAKAGKSVRIVCEILIKKNRSDVI